MNLQAEGLLLHFTFESPAANSVSIQLAVRFKIYVFLSTHFICLLRVIITTKTDYFLKHHISLGPYSVTDMFSVRYELNIYMNGSFHKVKPNVHIYTYFFFCNTTKSTCTLKIIPLNLTIFESCNAASDFPSVRAVA